MKAFGSSMLLMAVCAMPVAAQVKDASETEELPSEDATSLSMDVGLKLVSQYISRGVAFSDEASLQPYFTLHVAVPQLTGGEVTDAGIFAGSWSSMQSGSPGLGQASNGSLKGWYEMDLYAGIALQIAERWGFSTAYYRYESPSNSFRGYNDIELIVRFDDAGLWDEAGRFSLTPALRMVQEAGRPGRPDALYVQPSLTPKWWFGGEGRRAVRVSVPLVAGFSDDYYVGIDGGTPSWGYFRTGVNVAGQPFSGGLSGLTVDGGFDLWLLNESVANGLSDAELVARVGASWSF